MLRSPQQNRALHALLGDFARSWSHEGERLTAAEFKIILCSYFEAALAEADGRPIRNIPLPERTSQMDVSRMDNMIEYVYFIGAHMGIIFSE